MFKLFRYLEAREWRLIGVSFVFIVAQVWLDLKLPDFMQEITILIQTPGSELSSIWRAGGWMLLCALASVASAVVTGFSAARIAASFSQRLRSMLFNKVDSFSMEEINRFSTSSLITRSTNDVTQVQMFVTMGLQITVKAPIMAAWAIRKIAGKGFEWTLATGVTVLFVMAMLMAVMALAMPKFKKMQTLTDNLTSATRENLAGLRVVRAYNAEGFQEARFGAANNELASAQLYVGRTMAITMPFMMLAMNGLSLAIFAIGARLINEAGAADRLLLFADMAVFSQYAMQVVAAFMMMTMVLFMILPRAAVSAKRINEALDTEPTILSGDVERGERGVAGEVTFNRVSFKYPNAADYVLQDVSFTVKQGETIAFVGSTGSGKSTLVNLVPRFFDATSGEVLVDGVNVREYKLEALYNKIGYVPQKAVLFKGTVASNVAYGNNGAAAYESDEIARAIRIAQGADFVEKMDGGSDALIAQGGANVSGGQKQRLAIARAICRKPEIYIFDDSFSALDYRTDRVLRNALKKENTAGGGGAPVTCMIVAQRIGTIMDADQIVVLNDGRVAGKGSHKDLLKSCAVYREIAESQLSAEELAS